MPFSRSVVSSVRAAATRCFGVAFSSSVETMALVPRATASQSALPPSPTALGSAPLSRSSLTTLELLTAALDAHPRALICLKVHLELLRDLVVPDAEELGVDHVELAVLVESEHLAAKLSKK